MKKLITILAILSVTSILNAQEYRLNEKGYFNYEGVDAMAFDDFSRKVIREASHS